MLLIGRERRRPNTDEEWKRYIAERAASIGPLLKEFSLSTLGSVEFLKTSESKKRGALQYITPSTYEDRGNRTTYGREMQGIFKEFVHPTLSSQNPEGTSFFWGLNREKEWILVSVLLVWKWSPGTGSSSRAPTKSEWWERPKCLTINAVSLDEIANCFAEHRDTGAKFESIWTHLCSVVEKLEKNALRRTRVVQNVAESMRIENLMLDVVGG